jgi:hypothetical protein
LFVVDYEDPAHRNPPLPLTFQVTRQTTGDRFMLYALTAHRAILSWSMFSADPQTAS